MEQQPKPPASNYTAVYVIAAIVAFVLLRFLMGGYH